NQNPQTLAASLRVETPKSLKPEFRVYKPMATGPPRAPNAKQLLNVLLLPLTQRRNRFEGAKLFGTGVIAHKMHLDLFPRLSIDELGDVLPGTDSTPINSEYHVAAPQPDLLGSSSRHNLCNDEPWL